jgi:hypothetical protein
MKKLNLTLSITMFAAAAGIAGSAGADTMYKCTGANGKVTFTDQPCAGQGKASTLDVRSPQRDADVAQKADAASERLARSNESFNKRLAERQRAEAQEERQAEQDRWNRKMTEERRRAEKLAKEEEQARRLAIEGAAIRREQESNRRRGF